MRQKLKKITILEFCKDIFYRFEFSDPTVQVKITQAEVKPTPSPTETQTSTPVSTPTPQVTNVAKPKTTTITCIKGKTTKKVTAVNPKCPSGYKKK